MFVSGGGTNLQALIDAQDRGEIKNGKITFVLASNENAYALERAKKAGIESTVVNRKAYDTKADYDKAVLEALDGKGDRGASRQYTGAGCAGKRRACIRPIGLYCGPARRSRRAAGL